MSPLHEVAFGLVMIACTLGAVLSQTVLVAARRSGVYRTRAPSRAVLSSREPDAFFVVMQVWVGRLNLFVMGACTTAIGWAIIAAVGR